MLVYNNSVIEGINFIRSAEGGIVLGPGVLPRVALPIDLAAFPSGIVTGNEYRLTWNVPLINEGGMSQFLLALSGSNIDSGERGVGPQQWEFTADIDTNQIILQGSSGWLSVVTDIVLEAL